MSGFWWGVIIVGALWVYFSMRSKAKALKAFAAFDLAEPWFEEQGIKSSSVSFGTYDDASLVRTPSAIVLVGTGKSTMGEDVGFALEIVAGRGVVDHELLVPYGIATWHRNASMQAKLSGQPLIDVLVAMAINHGARYPTAP